MAGAAPTGDQRREAASCVERGLERYSEGRYEDARQAFEAALTAHPGHPRALECLAWVSDVASGKRTLQSGAYATIAEGDPLGEGASTSDDKIEAQRTGDAMAADGAASRTLLGMAPPADRLAPSQIEEAPDSVTREWSSTATGHNLPPLDVPELSDEQIASLLDAEGGRALILSKRGPLAGAAPTVANTAVITKEGPSVVVSGSLVVDAASTPSADAPDDEGGEDEGDEHDKTNVRLAGRVVEMVAEAEEEDEADARAVPPMPDPMTQRELRSEPTLTPLESTTDTGRISDGDQTSDDASSMPTNPFVQQRLMEIAPSLLSSAPAPVEELPAAPGGAPVAWAAARAALERGASREAFDAAERAIVALGGIDAPIPEEDLAVAMRAYEALIGDLGAVPRFGKATPDLDSRSAFLLSRMDGATNADDLLDVSGMRRVEALRLLAGLVAAGVVTMNK